MVSVHSETLTDFTFGELTWRTGHHNAKDNCFGIEGFFMLPRL